MTLGIVLNVRRVRTLTTLNSGLPMKPVCPAVSAMYFLATIMAASSFVVSVHAQQRQIVKLHPTPENIPQVTDPRFILHEEPGRTFMDETTHEKITIGVEDGEYHEMFGAVYDLALPGDGTILALDFENSEVRVFDYAGALLTVFGRSGDGPGEFRKNPWSISVADQGASVFVLEQYGRSAAAFERLDRSTFRAKAHIRTGVLAFTGCAMNGHFWVYGYDPAYEGVLYKFTDDGKHVASFLDFYKSPRRRVSVNMSRDGLLACSETSGIVALNQYWAPVLSGYKENGELAWRVKFAGFDPTFAAEYDNGMINMNPLKPGQRRFETVFTDPAGDFYVQYVTIQDRDVERVPNYGPLFKIDARTGSGTYLGISPSLDGIDSGYGFSVVNEPFPQVVIHRPKKGVSR